MKPIKFHGDCVSLGNNDDNVDDIHVLPLRYDYLDGGKVMVSCWRVDWRDILRMIFTRKLWLVVMGERWPPLFIESDKTFTGIDEYDLSNDSSAFVE